MNESDLDGIKITVGEGGSYDPIDEDVYEVMVEEIKAEMRPSFRDKDKDELSLNVIFNIIAGDNTGRKLYRRMSPHISIQRPSNLYKLTSAVEGKTLDGDFFEGFKLSSLLGKFVRVTVKNVTKGENTYSNIVDFMKTKMDDKPEKKKATKEQTDKEIVDELMPDKDSK